MTSNYNFFFFIEIHYLNIELFNFIKNQLKLEYDLNLTTNLNLFQFFHFRQGNIAIIYGNVENYNKFESLSNKLIKTLNIYDGFISILNLLFIGNENSHYWLTLDSFSNLKLKNQLFLGNIIYNTVSSNLKSSHINLINTIDAIQTK